MIRRPRPVLNTAAVAGLVHAFALIAAFLGYANAATALDTQSQTVGSVLIGAGTLVVHLVAAFAAQDQVTPLSDPRDFLGRALSVVQPVVPEIKQLVGQVEEIGRALILPGEGSAHGELTGPEPATDVEAPAEPSTDVEAPAEPSTDVEDAPAAPTAPIDDAPASDDPTGTVAVVLTTSN